MLGLILIAVGLVVAVTPAWLKVIAKGRVRETRLVGAALVVLGLVRMGSGAGYLLFWAGFAAGGAGLLGLIRPLHRLRITSRKMAAAVLGAALALMVTGAVIAGPGTPPETGPSEQTTAEAPPPTSPSQPAGGKGSTESAGATPAPEAAASVPTSSPSPPSGSSEDDASKPSDPLPTEPVPSGEPAKTAQPTKPALPTGVTVAVVTRVVDGDTIDVQYLEGAKLPATRVRMIGVDTPEVHGKKEPYGPFLKT